MKLTTNYRLQKPEKTDPVNVDDLNNNMDAVDSKMHDIETGSNTPSFTQADARANIVPGENTATLFGKISKFFADLNTVAFSGSFADLINRPAITGMTAVNNDTTTDEGSVADARIVKTHGDEIDALGTRATTAETNITALKAKSYDLANNLVTTAEGSCLDARQGKVLGDEVAVLNSNLNTLSFDKDSDGNWGYKVDGADPVVPFSNGSFYNVSQIFAQAVPGGVGLALSYYEKNKSSKVYFKTVATTANSSVTIYKHDGTSITTGISIAAKEDTIDLGTGSTAAYIQIVFPFNESVSGYVYSVKFI